MKEIFIYFILVLTLSFSVSAAAPGMERAMDALSTVAEFEISIPHPGYGAEEVNIWLVVGTVLVLYWIFFALTGKIGFLSEEDKARKGMSIGLTLISIFAAPLIEFISTMFQILFGWGYLLGLVGVAVLLFLGFRGLVSLTAKGVVKMGEASGDYGVPLGEGAKKVAKAFSHHGGNAVKGVKNQLAKQGSNAVKGVKSWNDKRLQKKEEKRINKAQEELDDYLKLLGKNKISQDNLSKAREGLINTLVEELRKEWSEIEEEKSEFTGEFSNFIKISENYYDIPNKDDENFNSKVKEYRDQVIAPGIEHVGEVRSSIEDFFNKNVEELRKNANEEKMKLSLGDLKKEEDEIEQIMDMCKNILNEGVYNSFNLYLKGKLDSTSEFKDKIKHHMNDFYYSMMSLWAVYEYVLSLRELFEVDELKVEIVKKSGKKDLKEEGNTIVQQLIQKTNEEKMKENIDYYRKEMEKYKDYESRANKDEKAVNEQEEKESKE